MSDDLRANSSQRGAIGALSALVTNPAFLTVSLFRLSNYLSKGGRIKRALGILVGRFNVMTSGCFIHSSSTVGSALCLPHPVGIVVGAHAKIGDNVTIYQNVTLGAREQSTFDYPIIGDGCVIYAGAVIIGKVEIGERVVIGANSVVTRDIPADSIAAGVPARVIRKAPTQVENVAKV